MEDDSTNTPPLALVLAGDAERSHPFVAMLAAGRHALVYARGPEEALQRMRGAAPDLVVVDHAPPGAALVDLLRQLRNGVLLEATTPLVLTSDAPLPREQRLAALAAGAWACVGPETDTEEALRLVRTFVSAKRDTDRLQLAGLVDPPTGLYNAQGLARRAREMGAEAFRKPGPLACVVFAAHQEPAARAEPIEPALARWAAALRVHGRRSDAIGRLSHVEFAVLAPGTGEQGAVRLAGRLVSLLEDGANRGAAAAAPPLGVRAGYEVVANLKYAPMEPVHLLVRASRAVRTGLPEAGNAWIRRFDPRRVSGSDR